MIAPIVHRGPDGQGIHLDRNVGLGHCRLSIIDLNTGAQPMANEDETVWIVFNGEIYNFQELRDGLVKRGHQFRSKTDTEVIIHLYEELGPACVEKLRGMFAFAIWDAGRRRLFLARDRVGIKPLYYCQTGDALYFASELKAIISDPTVSREIDLVAVRRFLGFYYLPWERTLFRSIRKLLPGHFLLADRDNVTTRQYWDLKFTRAREGVPFDQAVEELSSLLENTVRDHMIADVPVGVLLSGGVDSSAVLSLAVHGTAKKVKTFTVGFDGGQVVDERPYARMAAERFGTEHYEVSINAEDFWNFLPTYVWHMEDPVCEPPAVALYYVTRLAKDHVKVLLSGEGGDEAFAGYPNYPNMLKLRHLEKALGPLARPVGAVAALGGRVLGSERLQRYGYALGRPLPEHYFSRVSSPAGHFHSRAAQFFTPDFLSASAAPSPAGEMAVCLQPAQQWPLLDQMLYADTKTWLPDDLLIKADKITMANSLELRVPFLDHELVQFAATLNPAFKVQGRETKRVLKRALAQRVPQAILVRKKAGFPVPYERWLGGELRGRVQELLLDHNSLHRRYFNPASVRRMIRANSGASPFPEMIFSLLVLELWHRRFLTEAPRL